MSLSKTTVDLTGDVIEPVLGDTLEDRLIESQERNFFYRAVVVEVLNNLALRDDDQIKKLASPSKEGLPSEAAGAEGEKEKIPDIANLPALSHAPRNSVIVRLIGAPTSIGPGKKGRSSMQTIVCYPFFSSHFSLPVKVGEHVWVFSEVPLASKDNDVTPGNFNVWWLTRIVGSVLSEDLNYSHYDRKWNQSTKEGADSKRLPDPDDEDANDTEKEMEEGLYDPVPGFQNGSLVNNGNPDLFTLKYKEEYADYFDAWAAYDDFIIEPVPRFTKRPGDLVLQGSHNSSIILGTDRGWKHDNRPTAKGSATHGENASNAHRSSDEGPLTEGLGSIDLVAGLGRLQGPPADFEDAEPSVGTEPLVVKNTKENYETNKNPGVNESQSEDEVYGHYNERAFAPEGDPDFVNDASRIYITMKSNPDDQFAILTDNIPTAIGSEKLENKEETAAVVIKSDEVRIVARTQGLDSQSEAEPDTVHNVEGSIRIIKEGAVDDTACAIYLLPDGTIQISGKRIDLGREESTDGGKNATDTGVLEGEHKDREPYMRYSDFALWADALIDALVKSFDKAAFNIKMNAMAMDTGGNVGISGGLQVLIGPNAALAGAWGAMKGMAAGQKTLTKEGLLTPDLEALKSDSEDMKSIQSERIFGE